MRHENIAGL